MKKIKIKEKECFVLYFCQPGNTHWKWMDHLKNEKGKDYLKMRERKDGESRTFERKKTITKMNFQDTIF